MLSIGEKVLYGAAGTCTITEICTKKFGDGTEKEYYCLVPVHDNRSILYVPVGNPAAEAKLKKLLSQEEIEELIVSVGKEEPDWIDDEKSRQQAFREILKGGDRKKLILMTRAIYRHRQQVLAMGRKLHMSDERMYKDAEKLICEEFAVVLGMKPSEVIPFLVQRIGQ